MVLKVKIIRGRNNDDENTDTAINKAISGLSVKDIKYSEYTLDEDLGITGYTALIIHEV